MYSIRNCWVTNPVLAPWIIRPLGGLGVRTGNNTPRNTRRVPRTTHNPSQRSDDNEANFKHRRHIRVRVAFSADPMSEIGATLNLVSRFLQAPCQRKRHIELNSGTFRRLSKVLTRRQSVVSCLYDIGQDSQDTQSKYSRILFGIFR